MNRNVKWVLAALVAAGLLWWLQSLTGSQPMQRVEEEVDLNAIG